MRKKIRKIASNPLFSGSFFIFAGGIVASFFSFLSNVIFSRNLTLSDYGEYVSILSLVLLVIVPASCVVPAIVSTAGSYFAKDDTASLKALYIKFLKPIVLTALILTIIFISFIDPIGKFLNLNNSLFLILAFVTVFIGYMGTVNSAFLQARLSFVTISISSIISAATKLFIGSLLVFAGLGVSGTLLAFLLSMLLPVLIGFVVLRSIFMTKFDKVPHISYKNLIKVAIPSAISVFSINAFVSTDIILVKHFFSTNEAGLFAGLTLVGKVIFYLTAPISNVMFPVIVRKFNKGENYNQIFVYSFLLVLSIASFIMLFYFLFPTFTTLFFLKNVQYLAISGYLFLYGLFVTIYSLVSLLMYFFLSIKKDWVSYLMLVGAAAQAILIYAFHYDFTVVIGNSIVVLSLLLIILLLYYGIAIKPNNAKQKGS